MSVPDADTLIRLAEILEVSVSELLGTKIENENVASDVAEQLSRINEQLAIKNRRSRRIWKIVAIILAVIVLVNIFIAVFFSVPDLNSNTQNNPLAISDETISIDPQRRHRSKKSGSVLQSALRRCASFARKHGENGSGHQCPVPACGGASLGRWLEAQRHDPAQWSHHPAGQYE